MRLLPLFLLLPLVLLLLLGASPREDRGRKIYLEGAAEITAVIAAGGGTEGGTEVPASALPCAGCHGRDGRGQAEGGVSPSDLTRIDDERSLKRAISMGISSKGEPLQVAMPRYRMSQQDMADLISYIKTLGNQSDPGVSAAAVRIGAVLPPSGPLSSMSRAVREALIARFEEAGILWGRRIELHPLELSGPPQGWPAQVKDFLGKEKVFAVTGAFLAGADRELAGVF